VVVSGVSSTALAPRVLCDAGPAPVAALVLAVPDTEVVVTLFVLPEGIDFDELDSDPMDRIELSCPAKARQDEELEP